MTQVDLFGIGAHVAKWRNPFYARRIAVERRIERTTDPNQLAKLQHALKRIRSQEEITKALKA
ncbi:MAG: hypothetical protein ACM3IH_02430 [Sphingobacteriales bacterium]|jgi:hypothetical protein